MPLPTAAGWVTFATMGPQRPPPAITPEILLRAYAIGLFPMAESAEDPSLFWLDPEQRGIFPLDRMAVSRSLAKTLRQDRYVVTVDRDFDGVIEGCAAAATRPSPDLDQRPDPGALPEALRHRLRAHGRSLRERHSGRRPLWRGARRGLLRRKHVPHEPRPLPRSACCISRRACGAAAICCSTRSSSRRISRASAPSRSRAPPTRRRLAKAVSRRAEARAWSKQPLTGKDALAILTPDQ